jgi:ubiquitin carboxyl-terminal hydrolase 8
MSEIKAGNKGLANLGNTCYMNSALQCLSHLLTFHPLNETFLAQCAALSSECLMKEWYEFQRQMWSNEDDHMVNPSRLLKCFQRQCSENDLYFENFDQNDADEFLVLFLDLIHRGIRRKVSLKMNRVADPIITKAYDSWKKFYENDYSYIVQNFHSQMLGITACPECDYSTTSHDPVQVISLEVPKGARSLEDCLKAHTCLSELDGDNQWKCDQCHQFTKAKQRNLLWKTSDILIFLLKRYKNGQKIGRFIDYKDIFDIGAYTLNYGSRSSTTKYALQGVSVHDGSLGGGHYYAYCKNNLDQKWRKYNDTNVTEVSQEDALGTNGYVFFYKRL